jgi:translation initiation factor 3 subunit D
LASPLLVNESCPRNTYTPLFCSPPSQNRTNRRDVNRARDDRRSAGTQPMSAGQKVRERDRARLERKWQQRFGGGNGGRKRADRGLVQTKRDPSVAVQPTWQVVSEVELNRIGKTPGPPVREAVTLAAAGKVAFFDKAFDRITTKSERPLPSQARVPRVPSATEDAFLRGLIPEGADVVVHATDAVLATLMTSPRSVYSWDVVAVRSGNTILLDKREDSDFGSLALCLMRCFFFFFLFFFFFFFFFFGV